MRMNEGKNIGVLYHFTTLDSLKHMLTTGFIKGYNSVLDVPTISTSRNKYYYKQEHDTTKFAEVRICLDGNKISNKTPTHRGGDNRYENLAVVCHKCNNIKGSMTLEEFKQTKYYQENNI